MDKREREAYLFHALNHSGVGDARDLVFGPCVHHQHPVLFLDGLETLDDAGDPGLKLHQLHTTSVSLDALWIEQHSQKHTLHIRSPIKAKTERDMKNEKSGSITST